MSRRRRVAVFIVLVALAVGLYFLQRDQTFDRAESRSHPVNAAEEAVVAKVQSQYPPQCVTFEEWGPHMTRREIEALPNPPAVIPEVWVRVHYSVAREPPYEPLALDLVYGVVGEAVRWVGFNRHGDDWKGAARRGNPPFNPAGPPALKWWGPR